MYVGRLLVVGPGIGAYRVSSRSFPDRRIVDRPAGTLAVVPTPEATPTDNPYVAYDCLRTLDRRGVVGNGSHVDPIAEKIDLGYPPRDAVAFGLLAFDYERDDYDTPRIAGVIGARSATIGIVRREGLVVRSVEDPTLVATYERVEPGSIEFPAADAAAAAKAAYKLDFDHPVCAAGVSVGGGAIETAVYNGPEN